jgi:tRNA(fMet)-specific endonuclease VapC
MLRYLLDTNICIYVIKRRPESLLDRFNENASHLAISAITLAELLHGTENSSQPQRTLSVVEDFCSRLDVLDYGAKAAQHYGRIRAALERRGTPIGVNDLHIAAHARSEGLTLVSNNLREFERVEGLLYENWVGIHHEHSKACPASMNWADCPAVE